MNFKDDISPCMLDSVLVFQFLTLISNVLALVDSLVSHYISIITH